jgi:predicted nuclease of predicted toxin-antitoxin system
VRLLVDECLSHRVAKSLRTEGHDAVHVSDRGLLGHTDDEVMAGALEEGRSVVSADTDFGELLARTNANLPSVVLLRRQLHDPDDQAAVIAHVLELLADEIAAGAIVVITDDRVRVRSLPIGGPPR